MTENQLKNKEKKSIEKEGSALKDKNVIFIGSKPLVNYIRGIMTQFNKLNAEEVVIKSRGKFISKAVDVAEVAKRSLEDMKVQIKDIKIASESFESEGKKTNISTMDIILSK